MKEWMLENFRVFEPDTNWVPPVAFTFDKLKTPDDMRRYMEAFQAANIEVIQAHTKNHWGYAFYDTKIGYKHPALKIDYVDLVCKYAEEMDMKVMAYYCLSFDAKVVEMHPEWVQKDIDGRPMRLLFPRPDVTITSAVAHWGIPCYNSPYREYVLGMLDEVASNYRVHGFLLDILGVLSHNPGGIEGQRVKRLGCYCDYCQKTYRELYGGDIPTEPDWSDEWKRHVQWRLDYVEKFFEDIITTVQKHIPDVPVIRNFAGWPTSHWTSGQRARLAKGEKYLSGEDGGPYSGRAGINSSILKGLTKGKAGSFTLAPGYPIRDPPSMHCFKLEIMEALAHGGRVQIHNHVHDPDGTLDQGFLKMMKEAYGEMGAKQVFIHGSVSVPCIGVVHSDSSRLFYGQDDVYNRYGASIEGAVKLLLELHLPFDVIPEWNITPKTLTQYQILLLPNLAAMSNIHAETIRKYVRSGGSIIATFETSLYDEMAHRLPDYQLNDVFGLKYLGQSGEQKDIAYIYEGSYLKRLKHPILKDLPETDLRLGGFYIRTQATAGETIAFHRDPAVAKFPEKAVLWGTLPGLETAYPAIHLNAFGKGNAIFITNRFFKQYLPPAVGGVLRYDLPGSWWIRETFNGMLQWLGLKPPIWVNAPPTIEAAFFRNLSNKQIIVQIVNRSNIDVEVPVQNVAIYMDKNALQPKEAYQPWPARRSLMIKEEGEHLRIQLSKVRTHEVIVIQL